MPIEDSELNGVAALANDLEQADFKNVLVGGMALVILGSRRVTMDFDLLIDAGRDRTETLIDIMSRHHFELVTKFGADSNVLRTVDSANVAVVKLKMQDLQSAPFFNWKTRLRVDLLFNFPVSARDVAHRGTPVTTEAGMLRVASRKDLIQLKEIAIRDRKSQSDVQDLEFLRRITPPSASPGT